MEHFGSPEGDTIVLLHGWTETIGYWTPVISELATRGFRVVAVDLRGHGASGRAAGGDYSLARFGEDLEAVLEASVPTASTPWWSVIRSAPCRSRRGRSITRCRAGSGRRRC